MVVNEGNFSWTLFVSLEETKTNRLEFSPGKFVNTKKRRET
jgi:hypothetical protein